MNSVVLIMCLPSVRRIRRVTPVFDDTLDMSMWAVLMLSVGVGLRFVLLL